MSAFLQSGHSYDHNSSEIRVRLRPEADIVVDHNKAYTFAGPIKSKGFIRKLARTLLSVGSSTAGGVWPGVVATILRVHISYSEDTYGSCPKGSTNAAALIRPQSQGTDTDLVGPVCVSNPRMDCLR